MSEWVNQEINPEHVWINISKGKTVRAAALVSEYSGNTNIVRGVYKLEDESISTVKEIIKCAEKSGNIRFYILEMVEEE
jgi:hypothetical protein